MGHRCLALVLCFTGAAAAAQSNPNPVLPTAAERSGETPESSPHQNSSPTPAAASVQTSAQASAQTLPPIPQLLHDVEQHQKEAEAARRDYTYHVHLELQQLDHQGNVKKTTTEDSESIAIDGVRINRVVARDGKPLTPSETRKESDRIDKEVARAKARRERRATRGEPSDSNGDPIIPLSRILELGTFTNPRRVLLDGRPTVVLDYAGDPKAKIHNESEGIIRDLAGTVWIDEQDRVLVQGQGHFFHAFKIGGGLILNIHQGLTFDFRSTHVTGDVWLPATIDAQGRARLLLFDHIDGRFHLVSSNYRKFETSTTIIDSNRLIGPDGQPIPNPPPTAPAPTPPPTTPPSQREASPQP